MCQSHEHLGLGQHNSRTTESCSGSSSNSGNTNSSCSIGYCNSGVGMCLESLEHFNISKCRNVPTLHLVWSTELYIANVI